MLNKTKAEQEKKRMYKLDYRKETEKVTIKAKN